jgi:hypothetical protein
MQRRLDVDEGRWVTTEEDHKLHINDKGDIDKGNPYVIKAIHGYKAKSMKSSIPVGARVKSGDDYFVKTSSGDFVNPETGEVLDDDKISECKRDSETQIKDVYGKTIDLSHCPLEYGGKTKLNDATRAKVDAFEKKRRKAKIEYGCLLDDEGNPIGKEEYKGGHGSVSYPLIYAKFATSMTHIHPRPEGSNRIGGTFSGADLSWLDTTQVENMRAAAAEGIYSLSTNPKTDRAGLYQWAITQFKKNKDEYAKKIKSMSEELKKYESKFKHNEISYQEYKDQFDKYDKDTARYFNEWMVADHNSLLAGQEKFNYKYTLERWD